ncbi:lipoprotein NlpI [Aquimixticola soesokkakensis]|uniref:Lipoprotein NlpI n=1 Tax=Aquimixticola soesokkakensis TaxID=1519096 RepID=A0A1Y5SUH9_9RHOB|nr:tetratricopeptide repeat protein [Aquimixticola soesokkakensis]SLN48388.1 lipoprotein NlpI [Aquimixticola soesokkakensis]
MPARPTARPDFVHSLPVPVRFAQAGRQARLWMSGAVCAAVLTLACVPQGASAQDIGADAGAYLAIRAAQRDNNFSAVSDYALRALISDPENVDLLEAATTAALIAGNWDDAVQLATRLGALLPDNQAANMVLLAQEFREQNYDALTGDLTTGVGVSPLVNGLLGAWAELGKGDMSAALDGFDAVSDGPGLGAFGLYHKALALAQVGDFESAADILESPELPPTRHGAIALAQVLSQLERNEDAIAMLDTVFGRDLPPGLLTLRTRLEAGELIPFDSVATPVQGASEVFFSVASALEGELDDAYALLYVRLAQYLDPTMIDAQLLSADLLSRLGNAQLAIDAYALIPVDAPTYPMAALGQADALRAAGDDAGALEVLRALVASHPALSIAQVELGDALRREEDYAGAVSAYTDALATFETETSNEWFIHFARGISYERLDDWPKAEADFRRALELQPGQPQVLNYMGYSFLEMKTNYDEAMEMIRGAVAARPDDGYITDSLAWGLFRLGRYDEALPPMERAALLMPSDPIINDHFGDVLWAVGRTREARFQWRRAISFEPEPEELERIRKKLDVGLDRVLIDEGEEPTRPLSDG